MHKLNHFFFHRQLRWDLYAKFSEDDTNLVCRATRPIIVMSDYIESCHYLDLYYAN
jgi:hypothetical protein